MDPWNEAPIPIFSNGVLPWCATSLGHHVVHSMANETKKNSPPSSPTNKWTASKGNLTQRSRSCGRPCENAVWWHAQKTFATRLCRRWWGRVALTSQSIGIIVAAHYKPCIGPWALWVLRPFKKNAAGEGALWIGLTGGLKWRHAIN